MIGDARALVNIHAQGQENKSTARLYGSEIADKPGLRAVFWK